MPDARMKGTLERGAVADVYRNSLARIPTLFGRLVYLTRLRCIDTGRYEHAGLAQIFGENEADKALRKQHTMTFQSWLNLSSREQMADLQSYLQSLGTNRRTTLDTWQKLGPYRNLVPASAAVEEKSLFVADVESLLRSLTAEVGLVWRDPSA